MQVITYFLISSFQAYKAFTHFKKTYMYYSKKKKFKKVFILTTIFAAAAFFSFNLLIKKNPEGEVIAKINGEEIYKSEVERKLVDIFNNNNQNIKTPEVKNLPKEVLEILIKDIYLEKELTKKAEKSEIAKDQKVIDNIAYAKDKILRQSYIENLIKTSVTDEKINEKYLEISNNLEGKKEYALSHIVVKTKEEAEKILSEIKSAKSATNKFSELAKKYSIDKNTAEKGGNLDYILEDDMIKEISDSIDQLKSDEISNPIQTKFGWHLIKINDVREAKAPVFESIKENIRNQLTQEVVNDINSKITNDAKIEILIALEQPKEEEKPTEVNNSEAEKNEVVSENLDAAKADAELSEEESKTKDSEVKKEEKSEKKSNKKEEKKSESKKSDNKKGNSDSKDKKKN